MNGLTKNHEKRAQETTWIRGKSLYHLGVDAFLGVRIDITFELLLHNPLSLSWNFLPPIWIYLLSADAENHNR